MAYVTGTANSFADLLTALRNACTSNGWTLSGNVLHKGTCYAESMLNAGAYFSHPNPGSTISVRAGNGIDGSNALTDSAVSGVGAPRMGVVPSTTPLVDWVWPVTYHVHVLTAPDEVYFRVNYNGGQKWQQLSWGQSPASGNAGTGNWASAFMSGSIPPPSLTDSCLAVSPAGAVINVFSSLLLACEPFFGVPGSGGAVDGISANAHMHGAIDNTSGLPVWTPDNFAVTTSGSASAATAVVPLLAYSPNAWNQQAGLLPVHVLQYRPSAKVSLIGELGHLRFLRNDFIADGEIVTLGSDRWKVYPMHSKNIAARDGAPSHSGTLAVAVRYDGP